jgi:hypothetical protein
MNYTTIKIPVVVHRKLKELSLLTKVTQQDILIKSLSEFESILFWDNCESAYTESRKKKSNDDDEDYSGTLLDGLEDEY